MGNLREHADCGRVLQGIRAKALSLLPNKIMEDKAMKKYYKLSGIDKQGNRVYDCNCYMTKEEAEAVGKREYLRYKVEEIGRD